jgi:phenylalanyl-tRNA synthetase beta subunit
MHNSQKGRKYLVIDPARIKSYLDLPPSTIQNLTSSFLYPKQEAKKTIRQKIDMIALQEIYNNMLSDGSFKNRAALAKHFGVSRAWISTVLNRSKPTL